MRHHPSSSLAAREAFTALTGADVEQSIPERWQQQVDRAPDALVMKVGDTRYTYGEMDAWANRVAHALRARGAGSETGATAGSDLDAGAQRPVAVCFENGPTLIAALLGVLKAGSFYVVLDVNMPAARIRYIVEDSTAQLVLTDTAHHSVTRRAGLTDVPVLNVEELEPGLPESAPEVSIAPEALAYILYTSGSTGRPKGVMQTHRYVLNLVRSYTNNGLYGTDDRFAMLSSPIFAGAVRDTYCALLNGGPLYPFAAKAEGLGRLADWLRGEQITLLFMVPTAFRHFCHMLSGSETFPHLRMILLVSETIYKRDVDLYKHHFTDDCVLAATLGASEFSPVTQYFIDKQSEIPGNIVPVGYPPESAEISLLSEDDGPVPVGEVGQVLLTSRFLSPGYWRRPELSEAAYLPDPDGGNRRTFKTGDLGRLTADGCLTHVGRRDFQVQIRGYRVEIGEVETALLETGLVREAVVIAAPDHNDELQLVAYVVPTDADAPPTLRELRGLVAESLPDFMLPALVCPLEAFPLTPSGKVNRRLLPDPRTLPSEPAEDYVAPRTPLEQALAAIWEEVLMRSPIGIHEDFFEVGGHSLLAGQVIARIRDGWGVELPLRVAFDAPTLAQLAQHVEAEGGSGAPGDASEAVEERRRASAISPIADRHLPQPISISQQRLWVLEQLTDDKAAFNLARAFRLDGLLEVESLKKSVQSIVDRHENLRTTFATVDDQPVQVIAPELTFNLPVEDLSALPVEEHETRVRELLAEHIATPFDLQHGPLLRLLLIRESGTAHTLLVMMHHIISDDWSVQVFLRELSAIYAGLMEGGPSGLAPLEFQYVDHAAWHERRLTPQLLESQLGYWQQELAGASFELELPRDRVSSVANTHQGRIVPFELDASVTAGLSELAKRSSSTLFITLLATYAALLKRYGRGDELVIGTPIANRNPVASEPLIGFFVNSLALRIQTQPDMSFQQLLEHARQVALDAYSEADIPFDRVARALPLDRAQRSGALFQTMFVLQSVPKEELVMPGLRTELLDLDKPTAGSTFDLMLAMQETAGQLKGTFEYDANLFDTSTIQRMVRHFIALAEAVVEHPEQALDALPLLGEKERELLLEGWNDTRTNYPRDRCVHQLYEEQAARTPDAPAVEYGETRATYGQLNSRANRLAHHLRSLGVGPGSLVGVCLDRSLDLVVAFTAIVKAGGAYVPLDVDYPAERLGFMVQDTQAAVILSCAAHAGKFSETGATLVELDADSTLQTLAEQPGSNLPCETAPTDPAYVIYTSGSTGTPKGVVVPHRAINRLVRDTNYVNLQPRHRIGQAASASFDAVTFEIWGALTNGGTVVGVPRDVSLVPEDFARFLRESEISTLFLTTALCKQTVTAVPSAFGSLETLLFGGEAVDPAMVRTILAQGPPRILHHVYGPTESTTFASYHHIQGLDSVPDNAITVPIGLPLSNTTLHVLDERQQLVPVGVPGELYVGGDGLAIGYHERPELNAERFVANPLGEGRLYRTGDLVRRQADGAIVFLGRIDSQVKLRGFRIELGEIETAFRKQDIVQEVVVLLREDQPGDKRLVAYVTWSTGSDTDPGDDKSRTTAVRSALLDSLPEYMLPSAIVSLDELPLTPNGKLDRRALPAPDQELFRADTPYVAPQSPLQEQVREIWTEVLGAERIGIHDNFFDLGGHSLLATQVVSRLRAAFSVALPLQSVMGSPTIAGVTEHLEELQLAQTLIATEDPGDNESDDEDEDFLI